MDLNQKILAALLAAFFLIALIRIFSTPLRLAVRLLANTDVYKRQPSGHAQTSAHRR